MDSDSEMLGENVGVSSESDSEKVNDFVLDAVSVRVGGGTMLIDLTSTYSGVKKLGPNGPMAVRLAQMEPKFEVEVAS